MDEDPTTSQSLNQKATALHALAAGPLAASTSKLSALSRVIPSEKDFHFFNNFPEFKSPAIAIAEEAESTLRSIAEAEDFWESRRVPVLPSDLDESYEWLVNLNDELMERFGASMDEFKGMREREEGGGGRMAEDGFQVVYGKKKKKGREVEYERDDGGAAGVRVVARDQKTTAARLKVPFHIPTIKRPQQEFNILVNNSNRPFEHVWLERSEDGSRFVHPLEKLSLLDFVDRNIGNDDPVKPLPLESTPFKLVAGVKELKELVAKLRDVKEFAVDLEHNQYRSFQGLTCLMQISTRTEDFVIDTLKLRVHIGPYMREVFKDPTKRKVMHGADRDILWLQRDFGIYVCNLFDTGQASRVMQLERNSLEYLLHHFCEVNANKEYQNADWRLRPLPEEMVKYAREDTHYLLHIYDLMRNALLASSSSENDLLLEVYKRSYEVCIQLYEKEVLTDTSFLHIYGLQEADFNSKQLAIVFGLCEWRDKIAREEDESTGFILPNKALLEIAREMPLSSWKLRRLVKSKHQHVERHLNSVIGIIRSSVENSSSFERISEQLKIARELSAMQNIEEGNSEPLRVTEDLMESSIRQRDVLDCPSNATTAQSSEYNTSSSVAMDNDVKPATTKVPSGQIPLVGRCRWHDEKLQSAVISQGVCSFKLPSTDGAIEKEKMVYGITDPLESAKRACIPSVQISKKSSSAFGALLGSSSSRRKLNPYNGGTTMERDKNINMVEQIKSTVTLPFHTFSVADAPSEPVHPPPVTPEKCPGSPAETAKLEEVILLENESNSSRSPDESPKAAEGPKHREWYPGAFQSGVPEMEEGQMSLSDLSASFQQCFQSINERRGSRPNQRPQQQREVERSVPVKPFDYASARKNMKFGPEVKDGGGEVGDDSPGSRLGSGRNRRGPASGRANGVERSGGFEQPRRRQAFPLSGNRSMTFH